jgi:16S rRNA (guanine527-N7)-methyltransferase
MGDTPVPLPHPDLQRQLERARSIGFLGPGPIDAHLRHTQGFLDALREITGTVVDLGSGGGVPGLVIATARPDLALVLVEATAKRCRFLEEATRALGVAATVVEGRAEVVGHSDLRGTADAVVARSFGGPAATAECAAALLQVGGVLVVSEPPDVDLGRWSAPGLGKLGLRLGDRSTGSPWTQTLHQVEPCPPAFPRRDGLPAHRPLF